ERDPVQHEREARALVAGDAALDREHALRRLPAARRLDADGQPRRRRGCRPGGAAHGQQSERQRRDRRGDEEGAAHHLPPFSAAAAPAFAISSTSPAPFPRTCGKYISSAEAGSAVNEPAWTARTRWRKTCVPAARLFAKNIVRSS